METYKNDLTHIRQMMERSSTFISLSGLSGVGAGLAATLGCITAFYVLEKHGINYFDGKPNFYPYEVIFKLGIIAFTTLLFALSSGIFFTIRKSQKLGQTLWSSATKNLLLSLSVPLFTGGIFCILLLYHNVFYLVAPAMLLFYGLALTSAAKYTHQDVFWLGLLQILLGIVSTIFVGYGLLFWGIGFGILHILYGVLLHKKYN